MSLVREQLELASAHERLNAERIYKFQEFVQKADLIRWARKPEVRPLVPDTNVYMRWSFIGSLRALLP